MIPSGGVSHEVLTKPARAHVIGCWIEDGILSVRDDLPAPIAEAHEAIVSVSLAGICGTDLALLDGYRSFTGIVGHEFVGTVADGPPGWKGARVVADINVTCGSYPPESNRCTACGWGRRTHCERRTVVGIDGREGVFAQQVRLPLANLHRVPVLVSDDVAVFVEPLAAAFRVLEQVEVKQATRALVVGPGRLGQLVARTLATTGCRLTVTGRSDAGLARARNAGIAAIDLDSVEAGAFDVVVECTGHPDGLAIARGAVRPAGAIVIKSTYREPFEIDATSLAVDEITLIGSRCGPFAPAIEALASGSVDVSDLIGARFPLTDAVAAFEKAAEPGIGKVLLKP